MDRGKIVHRITSFERRFQRAAFTYISASIVDRASVWLRHVHDDHPASPIPQCARQPTADKTCAADDRYT